MIFSSAFTRTLISWLQTLPKADGPKGWVLLFLKSYCKFSKFSFKNLTKLKPQKLNQTSASKSWPNFSFKIFDLTSNLASKFMTKLLLQNLDQFSATKSGQISTSKFWTTGILQNLAWSNFSFNIVTKIQVQLLYQILASKPRPNYCQHFPQYQHQEFLSWHLQRSESHQ